MKQFQISPPNIRGGDIAPYDPNPPSNSNCAQAAAGIAVTD